jgi:16S rRNA (guanine966-N2)-methyltransferase
MRIIAGFHRGRQLVAPEGLTTRPMTDRVRESLFNILSTAVEDAVVLDLFCGSGALGLESLSRGARWCLFVDMDKEALAAVESNGRTLRLEGQMRIARRSALEPGRWILPPPDKFTLIFADPPYKMTLEPAGRQRLAAMAAELARLDAVAPGAVAMIRVKRGTPFDARWPGWRIVDERSYGTTTFYLMEYGPAATGGNDEFRMTND